MKRLICAILFAAGCQLGHAAELQIELQGVQSSQGHLLLAVYDNAEGFRQMQKPRMATMQAAQTGVNQISLSLPPGDYAISVFHDANDNRIMDRNPLGAPLEDYGFSNDAQGQMGPPSFEAARISLPQAGAKIQIKMH